MKKIVGYIGSYSFYYLGHFISIVMEKLDWDFLYPIYRELMNWSLNLQYWADIEKPWEEPTEKDIENE